MFFFSCVHNKVECPGVCLYFICVVCIRNWRALVIQWTLIIVNSRGPGKKFTISGGSL